MTIRISYLATVFISVLLIFIGHRFAVSGLFIFQQASQEIAQAKVQRVIQRITPLDEAGDIIPMQGDRLIFEAKITSGARKGNTVIASQNLIGFSGIMNKEVSVGDSVILLFFNNAEWRFHEYLRTGRLLGLVILFVLCVLVFGRKKGFNTILSLALTCIAIFAVFIPAILSGKNIYLMSMLVCSYTIIMTLLIVVGFHKKSLTAAMGCAGGIAVTALVSIIMDRLLFLSGIVDEHSRYIASLPVGNQLNLRAIIFAGITIGAMGAIMDVAISISSSLWEIKEKASRITFKALFRSGINIGRDIMGTMANTLILAYIGSSLSVVLVLSVYSNSLMSLLNSEMVVVEILQALAGSLGVLSALPLTALFCSMIYLRKKI